MLFKSVFRKEQYNLPTSKWVKPSTKSRKVKAQGGGTYPNQS